MAADPFTLFDQWLTEAKTSEPNDPNAMALATVNAAGQPSVRMVLLKGHGPDGFIFYTNQQSRKADDLRSDEHCSLMFHWKSLRKQVRIEGSVHGVDHETADAYFATRSRDSQLGAWASHQSRPLTERAMFDDRFIEMQARFAAQDVPRPPHWSGYCVIPERIEFWQDGAHRLHQRTLYTRTENGWETGLLQP